MRKVTLLLELEARAKELKEKADGKKIFLDNDEVIEIDVAIASWLDRTKEAILKNRWNFKGYVREYEDLLVGFHNVLQYIEYADNYKPGYVCRMIERELMKIEYISEYDLVIRVE